MSTHQNPFRTRSGVVPPYLLGRSDVITKINRSLEYPLSDEHGNMLLMGLRGIGKTVMLSEAGQLAKARGWIVIDSYLTESGLMNRLHNSVNEILRPHQRRVTGAGVSVLGSGANVGVSEPPTNSGNLNERLAEVLKKTKAPGILITVDEVHSTAGQAQRELREYGNEIQLAHRNGLPVMSLVAGLTSGINALLADKDENGKRTGATFLRRAAKEHLTDIDAEEIWQAYHSAAKKSGRLVGAKVIDLMTSAAHGYPYLFQLIGDRVWNITDTIIDEAHAIEGIESAKRRLGSAVLDTSLSDLSDLDRTFLLAMAQDNGPSQMADISERMGVSKQQATNYQKRLREADMIKRISNGVVDYTMPYMREHLRDHHASGMMDDSW